uniref:Uncharacterized protein n=1 Tax=Lotus japonicus TaxID=34305 RepID=I3TA05_LOTJA|nr:unknown [Lotus japonicus]
MMLFIWSCMTSGYATTRSNTDIKILLLCIHLIVLANPESTVNTFRFFM